MIITISGLPGSGKSTTGRRIAEELGYEFVAVGAKRREIAEKQGLTIDGLNKKDATLPYDETSDKVVDDYTKSLGKKGGDYVIDGWIAHHFIPPEKGIKFFFKADLEICVQRINRDTRVAESPMTIERLLNRVESQRLRMKEFYGVENFFEESRFDYIIDTTTLTIEEVTKKLLTIIKEEITTRGE